MKKILAVLMAVVLVATLSISAALTASATDEPTIVVSSATANPGDNVDITITFANNPGITTAKLKIAHTDDVTVNSVTFNKAELGGTTGTSKELTTNPLLLNWSNGGEDISGDTLFATINFTVSADATPGDKPLTVTYKAADFSTVDEEEVAFAISNGAITVNEGSAPQPTEPTIVVSSATANPGDNVDITITFANNPGITTAKLKIAHTDDVTVNSVTFNKAELGGTTGTSKELTTNPLLLNWSNGGEDISGDTLFATINFTVNAGATAGDKQLTVTYKAADFSTVDEEEVAFEISNGVITVTGCEHANTTEVSAVASTCKTQGHGAYTVCSDCGAVISGSNALLDLDPTNHEGGTEVRNAVAATCTAGGYSGDTYCLGCNTKIADGQNTDALGHTGGTANCHAKAVCTRCQQAYGDLDPTNHEGGTEVRNAVAATCTAGGYSGDTYCLGCNTKIAEGQNTDALGHTGGTANCHAKAVCTRCKQAYGDIDPSNHDGATEVRDAVPATCTAAGYSGDTYCLGCNTKIATGSVVPATEHSLGEWLYDETNHWKVCADCQNQFNVAVHDYNDVVTNPTCTAGGYTTHTCKVCGYSYKSDETNALGHTGGTANCHAKAICTRCQQAYGDLDPNNHDGATEVRNAKEPTTEAAGYTGDTYCLGCGTMIEKGKEIPALIVYDVEQTEGKTEEETAVYDATDAKEVGFTAKFAANKLKAVKINGVVVDEANYDVVEDGEDVKVVLKEEYLKTLGNGNYTITVVADNGYAQSTFTVKNVAGGSGETPSSSKTGDADIALLVIALVAMMGASLFAGTIYRKKNESK